MFDCRHDLLRHDLGEQQYRASHIPGAAFAHLDRDLSAPKTGRNGRHPLPDPQVFIAWLGAQGLKPADQVVAYDGGPGSMAARLWWMLRWIGHDAVAVLDGGLAKWMKEGRPVTAEVPAFPATAYRGKVRPQLSVDVSYVQSHLGDATLLDARAPARWRGELEPIDPVAGRIPRSLNRFSNDNLQADGTFKRSGSAQAGVPLGPRHPQARGHRQHLRLRRRCLPQPAGDGDRRLEGRAALRRLLERVDRGPEEAA